MDNLNENSRTETDNLIEFILQLDENFNINDIEDYKILVNLLYNNIMLLHEEDPAVNQAIGQLLMHVFLKLDPYGTEYFDIRDELFSHFLQGWMKDKIVP